MNRKLILFGVAAVAVATLLTGCETPYGDPNRAGTGALIGGGVGAASGALIGGTGGAALIGGAIGALGGGLIGHTMDDEAAARLRAQAPVTYQHINQGQPLAVADVKAMAQSRLSDDVIISQIRNTHTIYHLSAADIIDLKNSGVSDAVINFMINTPSTAAAYQPSENVVVTQAPPPPMVESYVVAPGPGYIWVGGDWRWGGSRWVWSNGYWCRPPRPSAVWIGGSWHHGSRGWYHMGGHWRG